MSTLANLSILKMVGKLKRAIAKRKAGTKLTDKLLDYRTVKVMLSLLYKLKIKIEFI